MNVADDLMNFEYLNLSMILRLAKDDIKTLDDLAELDSEELVGFLKEEGIDDETVAGDIIMAARAIGLMMKKQAKRLFLRQMTHHQLSKIKEPVSEEKKPYDPHKTASQMRGYTDEGTSLYSHWRDKIC